MTSYRNNRRPQRRTVGRTGRPNARPDNCRGCQLLIPAGGGELFREDSGAWSVVHITAAWAGSPVSGQYSGGCPEETDRMNRDGKFGGPDGPLSEHDRIASAAALWAASHEAPVQAPPGADLRDVSRRAGSRYAYTASGARMTMSSQRCEDAPCCGCCD